MSRPGNNEPAARLLYRVTEVAEALSLSRAKVYKLITSGALAVRHLREHRKRQTPSAWRPMTIRRADR